MTKHLSFATSLAALFGASALFAEAPAEDLPVTSGIVAHFDASAVATTLTDESGSVTNWTPITGSPALVSPALVYPDAIYEKSPVKVVTENGRRGIMMSHKEGGSDVFGFLCTPQSSTYTIRMAFVVARQVEKSYGGAIFGQIVGTSGRFLRTANAYTWNLASSHYNSSWVNGVAGVNFENVGGTDAPHLVAVASGSDRTVNSLGVAYALDDNGALKTASIVYNMCVVHEVVFYNRELSETERDRVSRYLIHKWNLDENADAVWTGAGSTTLFTDADNWEDGWVPSMFSRVILPASAEMEISGDVFVNSISPISESPVTLTLRVDDVARFNTRIGGAVSLRKTGNGELTLVGRQTYTGSTSVEAGVLKTPSAFSEADLEDFGTVQLHVDMAATSTVEFAASGYVQSWKSTTRNGIVLKSPSTSRLFDDAAYDPGDPYRVVDAQGRTCLRFGHPKDNESTYKNTFLFQTIDGEKVDFAPKTLFYVQRQHEDKKGGGLSGNITNATARIFRNSSNSCQWGEDNDHSFWINGKFRDKVDGVFTADFANSGTTRPNLLASVSNGDAFDIIGGQYLYNASTHAASSVSIVCGKMDLYEVIYFKEELSSDQIRQISTMLMDKWGVPTLDDTIVQAVYLPAGTPISVSGGATLDSDCLDVTFASISGGGTVKGSGTLDLAGGRCQARIDHGRLVNSSETPATVVMNVAQGETECVGIAPADGDFVVEKTGPGTLQVKDEIPLVGTMKLSGGEVAVLEPTLSELGEVTLHVDASESTTMTLDGSIVKEWRSLDGCSTKLVPAGDYFAGDSEVLFNTGYPIRNTSASGKESVRFGKDASGATTTYNFMVASAAFGARTVFLVATDLESSSATYTAGGALYGSANRMLHTWSDDSGAQPNLWYVAETDGNMWANGEKAGESRKVAATASGAQKPTLVVMRRQTSSAATWECVGAGWVARGSKTGELNQPVNIYSRMDLHELIVFDSELTDEQIVRLERKLMDKWGVPSQATVEYTVLPTAYTVSADASVDPGLSRFVPTALTFEVGGGAAVPVLSVTSALDLSQATLTLLGAQNAANGSFIHSQSTIEGAFAEEVGVPEKRRILYRRNDVFLGDSAGLILLLR